MEFEKIKKSLKTFFLVLGIFQVITVGLNIYNDGFELLTAIFGFTYIALYAIGYVSAGKGEKSAGIIGIIMGCVLIATILVFDIIDPIIGIFLIIDAVKYNKLYKNKELVLKTNPNQNIPMQGTTFTQENSAQTVEENQNNQTL